jgi:hypothetical protein
MNRHANAYRHPTCGGIKMMPERFPYLDGKPVFEHHL